MRQLEATTEEALLLRLACDSCRVNEDPDADRAVDVTAADGLDPSWRDVG